MSREEKKQRTKEAIVYYAVQLFKQKGVANVTVEEITQTCGIAKGTFFNYFPKKEHVLLHVAESYSGLLEQMVNRHQEGDLRQRMTNLCRELLTVYFKHNDVLRLVLAESVKAAVEGGETGNITLLEKAMQSMVDRATAEGIVQEKKDSGTIASVVVGIMLHTLMSMSQPPAKELVIDTFELRLAAAWEGIEK